MSIYLIGTLFIVGCIALLWVAGEAVENEEGFDETLNTIKTYTIKFGKAVKNHYSR